MNQKSYTLQDAIRIEAIKPQDSGNPTGQEEKGAFHLPAHGYSVSLRKGLGCGDLLQVSNLKGELSLEVLLTINGPVLLHLNRNGQTDTF